MGIIKAQLAAKTTGRSTFKISISASIAKDANNGNKRKVVAVLLVNSVIKDVKRVNKKMTSSISYC